MRKPTCAVACRLAVMKASGLNIPPNQNWDRDTLPPPLDFSNMSLYLHTALPRFPRLDTHEPTLSALEAGNWENQVGGTAPRRKLEIRPRISFVPLVLPKQYDLYTYATKKN
jgi:hypothetical protein